jgi:hypothetical protein
MTHDTQQRDGRISSGEHQIQRRQHQKQREQQQQQQVSYLAPGGKLPEKEHQSKHNPVSEASQIGFHSCDQ